ncbi:MAG: hypothetical protein G01um101424_273 [Parcubacteria group bacterium Gr01-1014_24]|nr:MAG: hypothetical protein G01um101424_273 [Parcubacteria group bacterium Gr01-1014_24]
MFDNTWYYTLSTISQTLAAILALVAVFIVLRLEGLGRSINDYRSRALKILEIKDLSSNSREKKRNTIKIILDDLCEFTQNYTEYRTKPGVNEDIGQLASKYQKNWRSSDDDFVQDTLNQLNFFVSQRDGAIKLIKWPGIIISTTICLSIILLSLTLWVINNLSIILLALLATFSIWSVIRACWKILTAIQTLE